MLVMAILALAISPVAHHARPLKTVHSASIVRHGHGRRRVRRMNLIWNKDLVVTAATRTARSPYRLPLSTLPEATIKDVAVNVDGRRCAIIGETLCPHRTRTILHMGDDRPSALMAP